MRMHLAMSPDRLFPRVMDNRTLVGQQRRLDAKREQQERTEVKTHAVKASEIAPKWIVVDADGETLGRLASEVAKVLQGKHTAQFSRHLDTGDYVIVVNAEKIHVTGKKLTQKKYYRHSQYPGGFKSVVLRDEMKAHPDRVIERAVRGMLPRGTLGTAMYGKLKVYAGPQHPHAAQQPVDWVPSVQEA
jgi:large subunit ribosomal protein L13